MSRENVTIGDVRDEVERAIRLRLHVRVKPERFQTQALRWPQSIDGDVIIMRDSDCGLAKSPYRWTATEWREHVGTGDHLNLWRQVGFWAFERADSPAVEAIRFCHECPCMAGRELFRLREENEQLKSALAGARGEEAGNA